MSDKTDTSPAAVERFSVFARHGTMHHDLNGSYVRHSDYESLSAQLAAANARAEHSEKLLCRLFNASPVFNRDSLYQDMKEKILALRDKPAPAVTVERVQHLKRGTTYQIVARGKLQTDTASEWNTRAKPTPAQIMADPRVKALVEALREIRDSPCMDPEGNSAIAAEALRAIAGGGDE